MATSVRLLFHGPEDHVVIPGLAEPAKRGTEFVVSPELAGRAAAWRPPRDGDELGFLQHERDADGAVTRVHDLGEGLLCQTFTDPATGAQVPSFTAAVTTKRQEG